MSLDCRDQLLPPCPSAHCAVFSIFNFSFTYALTFIHTIVTWIGMQGFLQVRRRSCCPPPTAVYILITLPRAAARGC